MRGEVPPCGTPRKGRAGRKGALARGAAWRRGRGVSERPSREGPPHDTSPHTPNGCLEWMGAGIVTRRPRPPVNGGGRTPQSIPDPATPPSGPPAFLGTWGWRQPGPTESNEDWLERTTRQRQAIIDAASNWLEFGRTVRVHPDPRAGGGDMAGRTGTIHRISSPVFADYATVQFAPQGRERVSRTRLLPLEILEPVE